MKKAGFAVLIALMLPVAAAAQTTYTIAELSTGDCTGYGINDVGDVTGGCGAVATLWSNGSAIALGRLPNGTYSLAQSSNASAAAVGNGDVGDSRPHALLFRAGKVIDIDPSAANAYAIRINAGGVIAGNALKGFGTCNSWVAAIYVEDRKKPGSFRRTDLQPYPGGDGKVRCEFATGANEAMQIVGWVQNSLFGQYGAFWNNDPGHTLSLLLPYPADWSSIAWGVNELGQAVGESHPPFSSRPVVWDNDAAHTPIDLGVLPGDNYGSAYAINSQGQAIGWSAYAVPGTWDVGPARFVVWRDGGVFDLRTLLDPAIAAGWSITNLQSINNGGQIVGTGTHDGIPAVFVMTPVNP